MARRVRYRCGRRRRPNRPPVLIKRIKKERNLTPTRWSRRVRKMPPASIQSLNEFKRGRTEIKREKYETKSTMTTVVGKATLTKSSSEFFVDYKRRHSQRLRKLNYPQENKGPKELVSILSAPKVIKKKQSKRPTKEYEVTIRGSSVKSKMILRKNLGPPKEIYNVSKTKLEKRKNFVLEVLNRGDVKQISRLHTVGNKTAERILLYRQLKGSFGNISELASMPDFNKYNYKKFVERNFIVEQAS